MRRAFFVVCVNHPQDFRKIFAMSLQRIDHDLCSPMIDLPWLCSTSIIFITIANWTRCWRLLLCDIILIARFYLARFLYAPRRGKNQINGGSAYNSKSRTQMSTVLRCRRWSRGTGDSRRETFSWHHRSWPGPDVGGSPPLHMSPPRFIIQIQIRKWRH